jgi:hypothetical protein
MGRSDIRSFPFVARCSPGFLLLADVLAEVVESLVLAMSVGHDAKFRRTGRIESFHFERECCHRNRWVSDLCRKHSIQLKNCEARGFSGFRSGAAS